MDISFELFTQQHLSYWQQWIIKPHVESTWFVTGYEPVDAIKEKIVGNGYDYPFVILLKNIPIGYILACDLYAYRRKSKNPKGLFANENPRTFCMDLFIGEEIYLNKGYGTKIVKAFVKKIFDEYKAKLIYIDPSAKNKRAIRCYEKAGFKFLRMENDGVNECYVMVMTPP